MSDTALWLEVLGQIEEAISRIERRFVGIQSADDLTSSDEGLDKLDGIAMMLIWMGEGIKNLEKYGGKALLEAHPEVDWKGAKGTRDILSHHYGNVDAEVVFNICANRIPTVKAAIQLIKDDLEDGNI